MSIRMLGIDYEKAKVDVRSRFSFTRKRSMQAMQEWRALPGIYGCIILSTCNRMEIWISTDTEWNGSLLDLLCSYEGVKKEAYETYFVEREEQAAVSHLFWLTCGLKSQILAEDQIISQVKDALSLSRENFTTDSVLEVLFRKAITAAKKVKTQVVFSRANETAMDQAVVLLQERGFALKGSRCMVIGNGEMGKLAAETLQQAGADVTVTIRQYHSGVVKVPANCHRINYSERLDLLDRCDLVVSATTSPNVTLTKEQVYQALESREQRQSLILIDLAVPRDIDPGIDALEGAELFNIDDFCLNGREDETNQEAFAHASDLLQEEMEEFYVWLNGRDMIPRIQSVKDAAVEDLYLRLHKSMGKIPLEESDRQQLKQSIDTAAGKVVTKMLFGLRDHLQREAFLDCLEGLETIYQEE